MIAIASRAEPDESLIDVKHASGYSAAGFSGIKAKVLLLVATDQRLWFCRHRDGVIQLQPLPYQGITIDRKRISVGWPKLEGTTITCGGSTAAWLGQAQSGRHQPRGFSQRLPSRAVVRRNIRRRRTGTPTPAGATSCGTGTEPAGRRTCRPTASPLRTPSANDRRWRRYGRL